MVTVHAPAKINLYLHVTGKREDGYHLLDSIVAFTECGDTVSVKAASDISLTIDGYFGKHLPTNEDNLVIKAALLMQQKFAINTGALIHLHKELPLASGIGGGSSDAAAAMLALNELWHIGATTTELAALALPLGADMPMCIHRCTAHVSGIGDVIKPLEHVAPMHMVLVNCGKAVSSAEIFRAGVAPMSGEVKKIDYSQGIAHAISPLHNDLAIHAIARVPEIQTTLSLLQSTDECTLARMSGSGATCFGIYDSAEQAQHAAETIAHAQPGWWVQATQTA